MASLNSANTYKNLIKKGFSDAPGDHLFLEFYYNDKLILHTKISHGSKKDLDDYLIKKMSEQCRISKKDFVEFAKCNISGDDYIKLLKDNKIIV